MNKPLKFKIKPLKFKMKAGKLCSAGFVCRQTRIPHTRTVRRSF